VPCTGRQELAKDKSGMTTAGLITGGVGLVAVPGGIYLVEPGA
jgi:hypothetical protein